MNKVELGQVFTERLIADYMVSLFDLNTSAYILDPCFGGGAFIDALQRSFYRNITGCEIDDYWYKRASDRFTGVQLIHGDFLKFYTDKPFDGIIMNPPYIRQEKINDLSEFGITKDVLAANPAFKVLPGTANLYMYFVLKALTLLKAVGQMIVIFPSSWLDARGGKNFKHYLYTEYDVIQQIHIHGEVFEEAALVDVVILKVINRKGTNSTQVFSLVANNGSILPTANNEENIDIGFNTSFLKYASVRRGLTTGFNEAFINPPADYKLHSYLYPILSSPKDMIGYDTTNARYDSLLLITPDTELNENVQAYLKYYEDIILENKNPKTLYNQILNGKAWYTLNTFSGKGIIFSYFVRNEMKFAVHEGPAIIRDNFYVITPAIDIFLMAALLNNYYTFYQLEKSGKRYGAGLLKLQRYDIENLKFPDLSLFTQEEVNSLICLSKTLIKTGAEENIRSITRVLSKASHVTDIEITEAWSDVKMRRLGGQN